MKELTLYHSTSDFFLPLIKSHGLGAQKIIHSWGILEFLKGINSLCEMHMQGNEYYISNKWVVDEIINQSCSESICFRHDRIYFSYNEYTAVGYAFNNRYSSEILTLCINFYNLLIENGRGQLIDKSMLKIDLEDFINFNHKKLLLKVKIRNPNILESEKYKSTTEQINELAKLKMGNQELYNLISRQYNFATKETIDFKDIDVFEIVNFSGDWMGYKYELKKYVC